LRSPAVDNLSELSRSKLFQEFLLRTTSLGLVNTRMKDFYDLWTIAKTLVLDKKGTKEAIQKVFSNRGTKYRTPSAFSKEFYDSSKVKKQWKSFLDSIGEKPIELKLVIHEIEKAFF